MIQAVLSDGVGSSSPENSPREASGSDLPGLEAISALQSYIDDLISPQTANPAGLTKNGSVLKESQPEKAQLASSIAPAMRKTSYEGLSEREVLFVKQLQIAQSRSRFKRAVSSVDNKLHCEMFVLNGHLLAIPANAIERVSKIGRVSAAVISSAHKVALSNEPVSGAWAQKYRQKYQELRAILQKPLGRLPDNSRESEPSIESEHFDAGPLNPDDALAIAEQGKSGLSVRLKGGERFIFVEDQLEEAVFDPMAIEFAEYELEEWSTELNSGLVGAAVDDHANLVYLFDPLQLDSIGDARLVLDD